MEGTVGHGGYFERLMVGLVSAEAAVQGEVGDEQFHLPHLLHRSLLLRLCVLSIGFGFGAPQGALVLGEEIVVELPHSLLEFEPFVAVLLAAHLVGEVPCGLPPLLYYSVD